MMSLKQLLVSPFSDKSRSMEGRDVWPHTRFFYKKKVYKKMTLKSSKS